MRDIPNLLVAGGIGLFAASIAICAPVAALIWWIEDRFGTEIAGAVLLGGVAVIGIVIGHWLTHRTASRQAEINSDVIHDAVDAFGKVAAVQREYARAEREQMAAATRRDQIDEGRVWRLAEQQRRLLNPPQQTEALPWQVVEPEDHRNGINYVE